MEQHVTAPLTIDSEALAQCCADICEDRKAEGVILFDVRTSSILADFYLICTGTSAPHISAIAQKLKNELAEKGVSPRGREGDAASHWVVLDYGVVLIHIMDPERRDFYRIEELWNADSIVRRGAGE